MGHSLEMDMMMWVMNAPEVSPAFLLAKHGNDVWLGNNRGNIYSEKHVSLDKKDRAFWDFDWEDMGTKDVPAWIDYVLEHTGRANLTYLAHSQGTTQFLAGAALMPEYYKSKVNGAILLAPPVSLYHNAVVPLRIASRKGIMETISAVAYDAKLLDWIPYSPALSKVLVGACQAVGEKLCVLVFKTVSGFDESDNFDYDRVLTMISMLPCGAGAYNFEHYGQLIHTEKEAFRRWDYGTAEKNMAKYNQTTPPDYNLAAINLPIAIFSGSRDVLADPKDVAWTR
jgi:lysosomal acid lipase/cholesteryl ester hydrolase